MARSHLGAAAWVGLRAPGGGLLGTARAISDGARQALVADIAVHAAHRGRGYGHALVGALLAHPRLRDVQFIRLGTADRQRFYERHGFVEASRVDLGFPSTAMLRVRG